jgi:nitrogen regulatory protein P-II 1
MFMIMFVSRTEEQASEMLDVWVQAGIQGVTILESAGMSKAKGFRDDLGIVVSLKSLTRAKEIHHRTLFSAVKDQETVDKVVQASTEYVRDWSSPEVGVLFVWPLTQSYGTDKVFNR